MIDIYEKYDIRPIQIEGLDLEPSHIDKIMKLIQEEADTLSGRDPVGRLYSVSRHIDEGMREGERKNE